MTSAESPSRSELAPQMDLLLPAADNGCSSELDMSETYFNDGSSREDDGDEVCLKWGRVRLTAFQLQALQTLRTRPPAMESLNLTQVLQLPMLPVSRQRMPDGSIVVTEDAAAAWLGGSAEAGIGGNEGQLPGSDSHAELAAPAVSLVPDTGLALGYALALAGADRTRHNAIKAMQEGSAESKPTGAATRQHPSGWSISEGAASLRYASEQRLRSIAEPGEWSLESLSVLHPSGADVVGANEGGRATGGRGGQAGNHGGVQTGGHSARAGDKEPTDQALAM